MISERCIGSFVTRPKRCNSDFSLTESWKYFYETDGDPVGWGGAGKVFRIKPKCQNPLHERKLSVPSNAVDGEVEPVCDIVNEIPNGKSLAIKIIRRFRFGRDSIEKIRKEIEMIRALQPSQGVDKNASVPSAAAPLLFSVHEDPTQVAIVMEYASGGSLFDLCRSCMPVNPAVPLRDFNLNNGLCSPHSRVPEPYVSSVLVRIVDALAYMHDKANIVHLDIKAENILLREPYPSPDVFITDFGLASVLSKSKPHKELAGTPDYTAPEVISYDPVTFATDMWSVGVLAYFMLTGVSPFLAETKALTLSNITQMKIDYPAHLFEHVTLPALDFIKSLIKRSPRARLSASQCSKHEWLQNQETFSSQSQVDHQPALSDESQKTLEGVEDEEDAATARSSSDESSTTTSSASSTSASPSRKRFALDALTDHADVADDLTALPHPPCVLEALPRHRHQHVRRRSVLCSISPGAREISPQD